MTNVLPPPALVLEGERHMPGHAMPYPSEPIRGVLDLALLTIDDMQGLPPEARLREEEEIKALLDELDTDDRRMGELHEWLRAAAGSGEMRYSTLARIMGVPQIAERTEEISGVEIASRFESRGYVKQAPKFSDQLEDESRKEVRLEYDGQTFRDAPEERGRRKHQITEIQGIRALNGFLGDFIRRSARHIASAGFGTMREAAKSMKENLTYIGGKELDEGSSGIGQYWAEYLQHDEAAQLCIITNTSLTGRRQGSKSMGMSDVYIRDKVLESMAKAEVPAEIMDRIITDPSKLTGRPEKVKVVFIDDWVVSGRQMNKKIQTALGFVDSKYHGAFEVDVLTAPPHLIDGGLSVGSMAVPIKAYHRAHRAPAETSEGMKCHITGSHATNNFGFSLEVEEMTKLSNQMLGPGQPVVQMPAVASVYREYWNRPAGSRL